MKRNFALVAALCICTLVVAAAPYSSWARANSQAQATPAAQSAPRTSGIADKTAGMQKFDGYFPFYWDARAGKIWLQIDKWDTEFLYLISLPAGLGSKRCGAGSWTGRRDACGEV